MEQYNVTGMSCAACSARVEKAVRAVPGVTDCAVSLLTNSMGVEGAAAPAAVIAAVTAAGYGAELKSEAGKAPAASAPGADALADRESPKLLRRLLWSLGFLLVLMYVSMGHMMWGFPLPKWFEGNHVAMGLTQLLLAAIVMVINQRFFISGTKALLHRAPNMDTLVSLGSAASFGWSVYVLFAMTRAQTDGNTAAVERYMHEFYFESAAMILTLITVGKLLEAKSKGRTTDALKGLMRLAPKTAVLIREGQEVTVPIEQVQKDDVFVVRPGESVPVDGVVLEGSSAVNESALTGESIPVDKVPGDLLSAATVNQSGFLKARATRVGEDTTLSKIIKMVSDAAATKAPIAKTADRVSGIFVPTVIGIAILTTVIWLLVGQSFAYALARGISVLVISCPCALGLATPVAIMVGSGVGARNGILFKTAVSLEQTGKVKVVALDKTGTITSGEPRVTDILPAPGVTEPELLTAALALEQKSEHPLAKAIVACAVGAATGRPPEADAGGQQATGNKAFPLGAELSGGQRDYMAISAAMLRKWYPTLSRCHGPEAVTDEGRSEPALSPLPIPDVTDFRALPGNGLEALLEGQRLLGGSVKYLSERTAVPEFLRAKAEALAGEGKTPLLFAHGDKLLGLIAVADVIKPESPQAVQELQNMGIDVVMLTGDNQRTAEAIGRQAGVNRVIAGVLPEGKEDVIRQLQQTGKVLMVGDGINDAPALTRADMGMAIGAGTDVAIDAADVVLMKSRLTDVSGAIRLSKATLRNIHENLFWAFFYNVIGIPLAAGAFVKLFGWTMNPMFGAAAMSLSSFCVVTNALRLNLFKLGNRQQATGNRRRGSGAAAEHVSAPRDSETVIAVKGMMCHNCERHVREALEALPGVEAASADYQTGLVTLTGDAADADLREAVRSAGYKLKKILRK